MDKIKKHFKKFMAEIMIVRHPVFEQWVFLLFCISLVIQALTGFFFTLFMTRGMTGFPVLFHMAAGGVFAVTLCVLAALRVKIFCSPGLWRQSPAAAVNEKRFSKSKGESLNKSFWKSRNLFSKRFLAAGGKINTGQAVLGWLVVLAGFMLVLTALILMTSLFSTEVNLSIAGLHRWAGLIVFAAAAVYAYYSYPVANHKKTGRKQQ